MIKIHFLNVHQGDSIILEFHQQGFVYWGVIDCHNPFSKDDSPALQFLKINNVKNLSFVCLTHPDYDHFSGILQLVEYFTTEGRTLQEYWDCGFDIQKYYHLFPSLINKHIYKLYNKIFTLSNSNKIEYLQIAPRQLPYNKNDIQIYSMAPLGVDIGNYIRSIEIHKNEDQYSFESNTNLLSIVFVIKHLNKFVFLTGDAKSKSIDKILQNLINVHNKPIKSFTKFDVIKVAHHGSKKSNHIGLWKNFSKQNETIATISHGCKYGHPNPETIKAILENDLKLYITNKIQNNHIENSNDELRILLGDSIYEGLEMTSISEKEVEPYHGNITVILDDQDHLSVSTEIVNPPLVKS